MKIFIDSSVLIEYEKQAQPELLETLRDSYHELYINILVASEYIYRLIGILAGKSPMSVCESRQIKEVLENHDTELFLSLLNLLQIPAEAIPLGLDFMKKYNLLPNDAFILATCKLQGVAILASFDSDFKNACTQEGIILITKASELMSLK